MANQGDRLKAQGISLSQYHLEGLKELAFAEGHLNMSRVVQVMLEAELARRFGRDWKHRYASKVDAEQPEAA